MDFAFLLVGAGILLFGLANAFCSFLLWKGLEYLVKEHQEKKSTIPQQNNEVEQIRKELDLHYAKKELDEVKKQGEKDEIMKVVLERIKKSVDGLAALPTDRKLTRDEAKKVMTEINSIMETSTQHDNKDIEDEIRRELGMSQ